MIRKRTLRAKKVARRVPSSKCHEDGIIRLQLEVSTMRASLFALFFLVACAAASDHTASQSTEKSREYEYVENRPWKVGSHFIADPLDCYGNPTTTADLEKKGTPIEPDEWFQVTVDPNQAAVLTVHGPKGTTLTGCVSEELSCDTVEPFHAAPDFRYSSVSLVLPPASNGKIERYALKVQAPSDEESFTSANESPEPPTAKGLSYHIEHFVYCGDKPCTVEDVKPDERCGYPFPDGFMTCWERDTHMLPDLVPAARCQFRNCTRIYQERGSDAALSGETREWAARSGVGIGCYSPALDHPAECLYEHNACTTKLHSDDGVCISGTKDECAAARAKCYPRECFGPYRDVWAED